MVPGSLRADPCAIFRASAYGDAELALADYLPFVSNMFLHGGWLHLILNMWMLWLFGPAVEDRLGPWRYLSFYLACGLAASVTHAAFNPTSTIPALGASGAIAGVLGCYIAHVPVRATDRSDPALVLPVLLRSTCDRLRGALVPGAGPARDG